MDDLSVEFFQMYYQTLGRGSNSVEKPKGGKIFITNTHEGKISMHSDTAENHSSFCLHYTRP